MSTRTLIATTLAAAVLSGCQNPDAPTTTSKPATGGSPRNAGEPPAPAAPAPAAQRPANLKATQTKAIDAFAELYGNWTYKTLGEHQQALAAISVGAARLSERQAAASSQSDGTIARGHIYNRAQIISISPDRARSGWWVLVTREQTGGNADYQGLPASYHVTLTQLATITGGYAVEQWLPQS
jgi:hypothetical protein